jgi:hypothetical protein
MAQTYFITEDDLLPYVNSVDLGVLDQGLDYWKQVSLAVVEEIRSYIGHRYNIDTDLRGLNLSADGLGITATANDRYYQTTTKKHYLCILDATAIDLTNTTYFTEIDSRNQVVLMRFIDMVLYHLHAHITPQNIPTIRQQRYDGDDSKQLGGAIGWLKMLQKGNVTAVLTVNLDSDGEQEGERITYGNISKASYKR